MRSRIGRVVLPFATGILAGSALLLLYLGLVTIAQGWDHALDLLIDDRFYVVPIVAGFSIQAGLFMYLYLLQVAASAAAVAGSGGVSTAAMLACCAHHLVDIAPIIGLSGLAIFLDAYKTPLLWLGIVMNAAGILYLVIRVIRQRRLNAEDSYLAHHHQGA
jgi:hypothetical protein